MQMIVSSVLVVALLAGVPAMLAAPQQVTARPGELTEAHAWIENRGRNQAIPIDLQQVNLDHPLRVSVINGDPSFGPANALPVRLERPLWEYQTVVINVNDDVTKALGPLGASGWEATGLAWPGRDGTTTVLMKRLR